MQKSDWRDAFGRFGPPLLWFAVISGLSTADFSAVQTARILMPLLRWLLPGASPETVDLLHLSIRKGMHLLEFAILALLWYRSLSRRGTGWQVRAAATALVVAVSCASLDEIHQLFEPGRTGSVRDVGWDSLGAILALAVRRMIWRS